MKNSETELMQGSPTAAPAPETSLPPWGETQVVGKGLPRVDAYERVSGSAVYTRDISMPGMLHGAIVRCPHAHARVKKVDLAAAMKMPGVRAVIKGDSPGARIPFYAGSKGPISWIFDSHCRHEGEEVAAVAAETYQQACDAAAAVKVDYEVLPFVVDPDAALAAGAPQVQDGGNSPGDPSVYERGQIAAGFAAADVVVERTFRTPTQIHTPMEVHGSVTQWDGNHLTVWDSSQGVFSCRAELAQCFKMPLSSVRVISHYMGGGFGSKIELSKHTVIAALLARVTARPVKLCLSREETMLCVGNRPANKIRIKAGAKKDGTLTAFEARLQGSVGAYPDGGTSAYQIQDLYQCPNVRVEERDVYVNAGKSRAFRAPGFPQCNWALEQVMDELAEKLSMDPIDLRLKNVPTVSQVRQGQPYTSTGLRQCLSEGARAFGWADARRRAATPGPVVKGVGMAAGMWGWEGEPVATAIVKLMSDGSANLNTGASDLGTGTKTVLAMVVCEELGLPLDRVQVENADTATTQYAPVAGGSQTVLVNAPAVRLAAAAVKGELLTLAARELGKPQSALSLRDGAILVASEGRKLPLTELKSLGERQMLVGVGRRGPHPEGKVALPFAVQFAEVEVNVRTGTVRLVRMLAVHDSGRVMNRLTYENQVFGGITMSSGLALMEERVLDRQTGKMVNANWHDYMIPTALDVPASLACNPVDPHDVECNLVGSKGLGEPATIPTAGAIANAVYNAIGVRFFDGPITPAKILDALARKGTEA